MRKIIIFNTNSVKYKENLELLSSIEDSVEEII